MLLSLIKPTSGDIKIFGKSLKTDRIEILRKIGAIVEKPDFYLYLSAYKNLEILGKVSGINPTKQKIMEVLELVGLDKRYKSKVKTFSHGMKQRLGLAQALLHDPELIILDEPTTGLDPQGIKDIRDLIIFLSKEKGKTIFLSSHILKEVELIASRMIIINKGQTIIEGKVDELLASEAMKVNYEFVDSSKVIELVVNSKWKDNFKVKEKEQYIFEMDKGEIPDLTNYFFENGVKVMSVIPSRSLEEYFLKITEGGK